MLEACSLAWLNMVTVELAQVESGFGRLAPLLASVVNTSPIVRGDAALLAAVFGDIKTQREFWGKEAASLLDFWHRGRSRGLRLLALPKDDFEKMIQYKEGDPVEFAIYGGPYTACICDETLRLHIPLFSSDDRPPTPSSGAATCLPLTHRAIAASNGFSLLTMQLTGWE